MLPSVVIWVGLLVARPITACISAILKKDRSNRENGDMIPYAVILVGILVARPNTAEIDTSFAPNSWEKGI